MMHLASFLFLVAPEPTPAPAPAVENTPPVEAPRDALHERDPFTPLFPAPDCSALSALDYFTVGNVIGEHGYHTIRATPSGHCVKVVSVDTTTNQTDTALLDEFLDESSSVVRQRVSLLLGQS